MIAEFVAVALAAQATPILPTAQAVPSAPPVSPEYTVGSTRLSDVVAKLGNPNSITTMSDGSVMAIFMSMRSRVKGASFVPIVGLFAGGAKSKVSTKIFTFGPDGLLKTWTSSDSASNCNAGIQGVKCR